MLPNPLPFFAELPDPRRETRNKLHQVEDIVMITLRPVLGGFEDWVSIEDFGYARAVAAGGARTSQWHPIA